MVSLLAALVTTGGSSVTDITILAASSLKAPLTEIAKNFESNHPNARLHLSFAGSQELATQIKLGASADLFFSADRAQMSEVLVAGKARWNKVEPFAANELSLLVSKEASTKIRSLADLNTPNLKICIGGHKVPIGAYTRQALEKASGKFGAPWLSAVRSNFVSMEPNVSAIVSRVEMNEADAGIVYKTDAIRAKRSIAIPIPRPWNVRTQYFAVVLKQTQNRKLSEAFLSLVLASNGQKVLAKFGFLRPK